jgi:hypothetical protein
MATFVLYCKSYAGDLKRVQRLWLSIEKFNCDRIPFFVSIPKADRALFEAAIGRHEGLIWVNDEDIVLANPRASLESYRIWDGRLSQQVVKSEFWRYARCDAYLCIDSESEFIRDFFTSDFLTEEGHPYTVMHQAKELLQLATNKGIQRVADDFHQGSAEIKAIFGRKGPDYDFGPTPVIWAASVWRDLDDAYLKPQNKTLWDAIAENPSELRWYGEALLQFQSVPLRPVEPLFRVYHYNWQWHTLRRLGETIEKLKGEYLGVLCQSSWQYSWDAGQQATRKSWLSRFWRAIRSGMARFR